MEEQLAILGGRTDSATSCVTSAEEDARVSVVTFPSQPDPATAGPTTATAVEHFCHRRGYHPRRLCRDPHPPDRRHGSRAPGRRPDPRALRHGDGPVEGRGRRDPAPATCQPCAPSPPGPNARRSWPPTRPGGWSAAEPPAAVIAPSRAPAWRSCSPTTPTPCGNECSGGCCMRRPHAPSCPIPAPSTCSRPPRPSSTRTGSAGPCTSCGTRRCSISPKPADRARIQAKSRHQHLASLGRYVRLGEETSARITAEADPVQRRRTR